MAVTKVEVGAHGAKDGVMVNDIKVVGEQAAAIVSFTDSTTGTASDTLDDTTAGTRDDLASIAAKIEEILVALRAHGIIAT